MMDEIEIIIEDCFSNDNFINNLMANLDKLARTTQNDLEVALNKFYNKYINQFILTRHKFGFEIVNKFQLDSMLVLRVRNSPATYCCD
jgi:hypothetical protein